MSGWSGEADVQSLLDQVFDSQKPPSKNDIKQFGDIAVTHVRYFKVIVHLVEKFVRRMPPNRRSTSLHVIDAITKASKKKFGAKDVYAPRFTRNMEHTMRYVRECTGREREIAKHTVEAWQTNGLFPDFDFAPTLEKLEVAPRSHGRESSGHKHDSRRPAGPEGRPSAISKTNPSAQPINTPFAMNSAPVQPAAPVQEKEPEEEIQVAAFDYGSDEDDEERIESALLRVDQHANKASAPTTAPEDPVAKKEDEEKRRSAKSGGPIELPDGRVLIQSKAVFIGNLAPFMTEQWIMNIAKDYGEVASVNILNPAGSTKPPSAFINYQDRESAEKARWGITEGTVGHPVAVGWGKGSLPHELFDSKAGEAKLPKDHEYVKRLEKNQRNESRQQHGGDKPAAPTGMRPGGWGSGLQQQQQQQQQMAGGPPMPPPGFAAVPPPANSGGPPMPPPGFMAAPPPGSSQPNQWPQTQGGYGGYPQQQQDRGRDSYNNRGSGYRDHRDRSPGRYDNHRSRSPPRNRY